MNGSHRGKKWLFDEDAADQVGCSLFCKASWHADLMMKSSQGVSTRLPVVARDVQRPVHVTSDNDGFIRMSISDMKRPMLLPFSSTRTAEVSLRANKEHNIKSDVLTNLHHHSAS